MRVTGQHPRRNELCGHVLWCEEGSIVGTGNAAVEIRFNKYMRRHSVLTVEELRTLTDDLRIHYTPKSSANALMGLISASLDQSNGSEGDGNGCN